MFTCVFTWVFFTRFTLQLVFYSIFFLSLVTKNGNVQIWLSVVVVFFFYWCCVNFNWERMREHKLHLNQIVWNELFVEFNVNELSMDCWKFHSIHSIKCRLMRTNFFFFSHIHQIQTAKFHRIDFSASDLLGFYCYSFVIKWHAFRIYAYNDQSIVRRTFFACVCVKISNKKLVRLIWKECHLYV